MSEKATSQNSGRSADLFRTAGIILVIACLLGALFCLVGIVAGWQARSYIESQLAENLSSLDAALEATSQGLANVENTLRNTLTSLETLQTTLETTASTVETTAPALHSLVIITQKDLPNIVTAAQTSLNSAQASARVIDQVMRALAVLPIVDYDPQKPLHESLGELSTSLDRLPAAFFTMQAGMAATERNLQTIQGDISQVAGDVEAIRLSLGESQSVLSEYQELTDHLQNKINELGKKMPGWLSTTAWLITLILAWAVLVQSGLIVLGLALIKSAQHFPQHGL